MKPLLHSLLILTLLASGLVQAQMPLWSGLVSDQPGMNTEPASEGSATSEPRSKKAHPCLHQTAQVGHAHGLHRVDKHNLNSENLGMLDSGNPLPVSGCPHHQQADGHCSSSSTNCLCCASAMAASLIPSSLTQSVARQKVFPCLALSQSTRAPVLALLQRPPILFS